MIQKLLYKNIWIKLIILYLLFKKIINIDLIKKFLKKNILYKIPLIKSKIQNEKNKIHSEIKNDLNKSLIDLEIYNKIPENSQSESDIVILLDKYKNMGKFNAKDGRISGTVYTNSEQINNFMEKIFLKFYRSNPLHPDIFPGVRKMEAEIIQMCANLLNSKSPCSGSFTSGGTESIILACRCYRECAYEMGIKKPNIIVCDNAHAAYWKAADYLNIDIIELASDKNEYNLKEKEISKYYNKNTIAIIASAPSFNFGLLDEIDKISEFCILKNIYLHIDMCLGGFILPFINKYKNISFTNEAISSISLDTHKYGCGPKGGSVILYKNRDLYKKQMFIKENWTGGIYGTQNITGSRCGNTISLTWATLMNIGYNNYKENAENIMNLTLFLRNEIKKIKDIFCYGDPEICIVAIGSNKFSIYQLADKLKILGWNLNYLQKPDSFHLCITNCHKKENIITFIEDIKKCMETIDYNLSNKGSSLYATTTKINDDSLVSDTVKEYFYILNDIE